MKLITLTDNATNNGSILYPPTCSQCPDRGNCGQCIAF
jgi:hypothetical protein